jgi:hypothetical protein
MTWPLVKRSVSAAAVHANPMKVTQSINILSFMHPSFLRASTSIGRIPVGGFYGRRHHLPPFVTFGENIYDWQNL